MEACTRATHDQAVFIPAIERFLGDFAIDHQVQSPVSTTVNGKRVAVIGGGPAGLSCAYYLALTGFPVTVFEAKEALGGVLRYGIPSYRLPKNILDAEIARVERLGVAFRTSTAVGRDVTMEELTEYSAFFISVGLQKNRLLGMEHEDANGVMPGLEFLESINSGKPVAVGRHAVVVGGGNTAMDVARSALRLGAHVTVLYRRTRQEMPAIEDEIEDARAEGVVFRFLATPHRIELSQGHITRLTCQEMTLGELDETGRRRPIPVDSYFDIPADSLLTATGEVADTAAFEPMARIERGLIVADQFGRTSNPKVFAGGDIVSGASTVVNAIARGRGAAELISSELTGGKFHPRTEKKVVAMEDVNTAYFARTPRTPMTDNEHARQSFEEVHNGYTCDEVRSELDRCFSCGVCDGCDNCYVFCPDVAISRENGVYTIDYDFCKGCLICVRECPRAVLSTVNEAS